MPWLGTIQATTPITSPRALKSGLPLLPAALGRRYLQPTALRIRFQKRLHLLRHLRSLADGTDDTVGDGELEPARMADGDHCVTLLHVFGNVQR